MKPLIRQLQETDYQNSADIFYEVFGPDGCGETWTKETSFAHIKENAFAPQYNFCVENEEGMIGIIIAFPMIRDDGTDLFIDAIAVTSNEQGNGIGKMLWEKVVQVAKENKLKNVRLLANPHLPSFQWYKKMNLQETGWTELAKPLF
jgi:predicted N-acetyltransferase YhbS